MNYSQAFEIFERHIEDVSFNGTPKELYEPIRYTMEMGGKRIRPALLLMAGSIFHSKVQNFLNAAVGIEIFHNFTLVHDDIMDKAPLRRGKKTVHKKWNNDIAILSGDVMFVTACQYLLQCKQQRVIQVMNMFYDTAKQVCEGQQMDMNFEKMENVSIDEYLKMIELKTAVLLGCSLKIGAMLGGANRKDADNLCDFGKHIGIAFQLQDDILDAYGDGNKFGKRVGGDIISNKKTFLYLTALKNADDDMLKRIDKAMSISNKVEKVKQMLEIYNDMNIRRISEEKMMDYFKMGIKFLEEVKAAEEKKQALKDLAENLMSRVS